MRIRMLLPFFHYFSRVRTRHTWKVNALSFKRGFNMEALESLNLQAIVAGQDYERQLERLVSII